jgi:hypothetical protein
MAETFQALRRELAAVRETNVMMLCDVDHIAELLGCFDGMLEALQASIAAAEKIDQPGGWDRAMDAKHLSLAAIAKAEGCR